MNEEAYLRLVRGETRGPMAALARGMLSAAAMPYGLAVRARNLAFDRGWKTIHRVGLPIVSIGNITLGGTGKTPMVEWVARRMRREGLRVAILSRGYGGTEGLNDEGRVLEENLPDVPQMQNPDRLAMAHTCIEELESQALVLDDGFQHRRLSRDLDIVLIDALQPFGLGKIFPRGLLREPVGSMKRADVVVLSRADLVRPERRAEIRAEAERQAGRSKWVEARHAPRDLFDSNGNSEPLDSLAGRRIAAFCGIGNPEGFRRTLASLGIEPIGFRAFPDHHAYSAADVGDLSRWAASLGADLLLTTQKDSVKLRATALGSVPLRALRIGLEIMEGEAILEEALRGVLAKYA